MMTKVGVARKERVGLREVMVQADGVLLHASCVPHGADVVARIREWIRRRSIGQRIKRVDVLRNGIEAIGGNQIAGKRVTNEAASIGVGSRRPGIVNRNYRSGGAE